MPEIDDETAAALASVVPIGEAPTWQEVALGEAVLEQIRKRQTDSQLPVEPKEEP